MNAIQSADQVSITVLVDNYTDLLLVENTQQVKRPHLAYGKTLLAEHGLSFLVRVQSGTKTHTVLMDAGASETVFFENCAALGVNPDDIEEIAISHGHYDHIGALTSILRSSSCRIPVYMHPGAFVTRRKKCPDGTYIDLPPLKKDEIAHAGAIITMSTTPSLMGNRYVLLTGEIERSTPFEQGSPVLEAKEGGEYVRDTFQDDQSLILHLKDRGLIIISGCAHAGIINSVMYARKITGIHNVHAIIGGFHLSGPHANDKIIPTIREMKEINPDFVIPVHCSGWDTQVCFAREMPDKFMLSTVGTTFEFH